MQKELDERAEAIVIQLLSTLSEQDMMLLLPKIIHKLKLHLENYDNSGEIISAVPLDDEHIMQIEKMLEKKIGQKVVLKNKVDKHIIGGIIIRYKDIIIDQSLQRQLKDIQQEVYES